MASSKQHQAPEPSAPAARPRFVDNAGHIDPEHARRLRNLSAKGKRHDDEDHAFVDQPRTLVDMAESFGEQSVINMTTGEQEAVASSPLGANSPGASTTTEGDLDSTLWERELVADAEDVLQDTVSPDDDLDSEREEDAPDSEREQRT